MRTFFALQGGYLFTGGWCSIITWANKKIAVNPDVIKILTARGGEREARVIAEVTVDGIRIISNGCTVSTKSLSRGK